MRFIPTDFSVQPYPDGDPRRMVVNIRGISIDERALVAAIVEGLREARIMRVLGDDRKPEDCE